MNTDTYWWKDTPPQPFNFPIWAVLDDHSIYTVELLREPSALEWVKIKAWTPARIPEPPLERWEQLANEYFRLKIESDESIRSAKDWFMEGIKYGKDQNFITNTPQTELKRTYSTQDEFKAKYGEYGEKYKPQTDPNTPWNPNWDNV